MRPSFSMLPGNLAGQFFCAENHVFFLLDFLSPVASESLFSQHPPSCLFYPSGKSYRIYKYL